MRNISWLGEGGGRLFRVGVGLVVFGVFDFLSLVGLLRSE